MKLDILTIAFISGLLFLIQAIVIYVQYKVNPTLQGIRWWVFGSAFIAVGLMLINMMVIKPLEMLARVANPLMVLGQILLYIGVVRFLGRKEKKWIAISIYFLFILSYLYYMYININLSGRAEVITISTSIISFITAYYLFFKRDRNISSSANFTAIVFLAYGCFLMVRFLFAILSPPAQSYADQSQLLLLAFVVPIITGTLWTFGFIIMVNQQLNVENWEAKERMQHIFNTSPDALLITRLEDGLFVDVNEGVSVLSGYDRDEIIGRTTMEVNIWQNNSERQDFITMLKEKGFCENKEYVFRRKDKTQFFGMISAKIITIQHQPHIISVVRDINERKQAEEAIRELIKQLEIEKNTALINSITDSLTGLANRRCFDETLRCEFKRLRRANSALSLIILDIDYFKKFNDHYGHIAGDNCLRQIGTLLKSIVGRESDMVARYGGEEFVVILPKTEEQGALVLAEKIKKEIEELAIPHETSDISQYITASLGIVTVNTPEMETPEQLVALADEALYIAKQSGRNRIERAHS